MKKKIGALKLLESEAKVLLDQLVTVRDCLNSEDLLRVSKEDIENNKEIAEIIDSISLTMEECENIARLDVF